MFTQLSTRLTKGLDSLRGKKTLKEEDVDKVLKEIRLALLDADVALAVVKTFIQTVKERTEGLETSKVINPSQQVVKIVHEELTNLLGGEVRDLNLNKTPPTAIMLLGLQGAGKTTLAGKLALKLREEGHTPLLVACDLMRPNAVQQLQVVGEQAGVKVYAPETGSGQGDPVKVAKDGLLKATREQYDIVIFDTAGRLSVDKDLMLQAKNIKEAVKADETLLVLDAMIGQDALQVIKEFDDQVGFDGVVLSKLDGDARGGAALSIKSQTGKHILYASVGEKLTDLEKFHPDRMAGRILDLGDALSLIEQAEKAFSEEERDNLGNKIAKGKDFNYEDLKDQVLTLRKMGGMSKLLGLLPGGGQIKEQVGEIDESKLDKMVAIINSMTLEERTNPKLITPGRKARIARGSGVGVEDVLTLEKQLIEASKAMKQAGREYGLGDQSTNRRAQKQNKGKGRQGRSGNPAKRGK